MIVNGDLPSVTHVLLQGSDGFRFADLATGKLQADRPWGGGYAGGVLPRPGGGWACICSTYIGGGTASPAGLAVALKSVDASGTPNGSVDLRTVIAESSPAALSASTNVDLQVTASPDGRSAYVGWSHRTRTGWRAGVDVVDLTALRTLTVIDLPDVDRSGVANGTSWVRLAPRVSLDPNGKVALISSDWFVDDPATATPPFGTDRWSAAVGGNEAPMAIRQAPDPAGASCDTSGQGLIDDASYFVACISNSGDARVDRYHLDGSAIGSDGIGRWAGGFGFLSARLGSRLFLWDAQAHTLVRYDLTTRASDRLTVPATGGVRGPDDPIGPVGRALGAWLAPTAQAKVFLQPAIALSPDGMTLYALGIAGGAIEPSGSAGIFAFGVGGDALVLKSHWEPTADFVSLAVSEDGAFVYAAGMGGVDAAGNAAAGVSSSVTVFDATTGSVRLLAGRLPGTDLRFVEPIVR